MAERIAEVAAAFEEWAAKSLGCLAIWFTDWPVSELQRRKGALWISSLFSLVGVAMLLWELVRGAKVHFMYFLIPITAPIMVAAGGLILIDALRKTRFVDHPSVIGNVFNFILSLGVSISIGLGSVPLVFLACTYTVWGTLIEMVFDSPIAWMSTVASIAVSLTLNLAAAEGGRHLWLLIAPVILGILLILFSWRFKSSIFPAPALLYHAMTDPADALVADDTTPGIQSESASANPSVSLDITTSGDQSGAAYPPVSESAALGNQPQPAYSTSAGPSMSVDVPFYTPPSSEPSPVDTDYLTAEGSPFIRPRDALVLEIEPAD